MISPAIQQLARYKLLQEGLYDLLQDLRSHGYQAGVDHYLSAHKLFIIWQPQPEKSKDVIRAALSAIFATCPDEQYQFRDLFERWYERCLPQAPLEVQPKPLKPPTWAERVTLSKKHGLVIGLVVILQGWFIYLGLKQTELPVTPIDTTKQVTTITDNPATDIIKDTLTSYIPAPHTPPEPVIPPPEYSEFSVLGVTVDNSLLKTLCALPLLAWLYWLLNRLTLRYLTLNKRRPLPDEKNRLESLSFQADAQNVFPNHAMQPLWRTWRSFLPFRSLRLHTNKTVKKTLDNGGYFQAKFRNRLLPPEYVLLIDRRHYHDFCASLGVEFKQRMQSEGLFVHQYYYDENPQYCWMQAKPDRFYNLQQLAHRHQGQHLIIIGEAYSFYDPSTGQLMSMGNQGSWQNKTLLTINTPEEWHTAELCLSKTGCKIAPFSRRGLLALLDLSKTKSQNLNHSLSLDYRDTPVPRAFNENSWQWLDESKPTKNKAEQVIHHLKGYLGRDGFMLLTAVAAYPALDWPLTLALDSQLQLAKDEQREIRLRKLARLPWFRHGNLPNVWRVLLLNSLGADLFTEIYKAYNALLEAANTKHTIIQLPVSMPDLTSAKKNQSEWIDTARPGNPLQEYVFASVIHGRKPKLHEFTLTEFIDGWIPSHYWRGILIKAVLAFLFAGTLSFGAYQWVSHNQNRQTRMQQQLSGYSVLIFSTNPTLNEYATRLQTILSSWGFADFNVVHSEKAAVAPLAHDKLSNEIFYPENTPPVLLNLLAKRLQYLTYGADVKLTKNAQRTDRTVYVYIDKPYQTQAIFRDFIQLDATPVTESNKQQIIEDMIQLFETGSKTRDYGKVDIFKDGPKGAAQIHYGFFHETEFGVLQAMIEAYIKQNGLYAKQLSSYWPQIGQIALTTNTDFINLLRQASTDPVMHTVQDSFYQKSYINPGKNWAKNHGITTPLGIAVVCDSFVHSGNLPAFLINKLPPIPNGQFSDQQQEKSWITTYVSARKQWLQTHDNTLVQKTVYRPDTFLKLIHDNNWNLDLPIKINFSGTIVELSE